MTINLTLKCIFDVKYATEHKADGLRFVLVYAIIFSPRMLKLSAKAS